MTEPEDHAARLAKLHGALASMSESLRAEVVATLSADLSPTTAFALGQALGMLMNAKALVGRDIDDLTAGDVSGPRRLRDARQ